MPSADECKRMFPDWGMSNKDLLFSTWLRYGLSNRLFVVFFYLYIDPLLINIKFSAKVLILNVKHKASTYLKKVFTDKGGMH